MNPHCANDLKHGYPGGEVSLLPAQALDGRIEFLLAGGDHTLAVERDQGLLAFDARVEGGADTPNAGRVGLHSGSCG
ncbi:MAG TPA: hypothetical protein VG167_03585 [Verrucomicrobiae bacterium]|nr:hypothetical protein [Verrucomicrobiae bacterium]